MVKKYKDWFQRVSFIFPYLREGGKEGKAGKCKDGNGEAGQKGRGRTEY